MLELINALKFVSGPLTLVAFVILVIAYRDNRKRDAKQKLIKSASESDRTPLIEAALDGFRINYGNLTRNQKFELYKQALHQKQRRFVITCATLVVLISVSCVTFLVALGNGGSTNDPSEKSELTQKNSVPPSGPGIGVPPDPPKDPDTSAPNECNDGYKAKHRFENIIVKNDTDEELFLCTKAHCPPKVDCSSDWFYSPISAIEQQTLSNWRGGCKYVVVIHPKTGKYFIVGWKKFGWGKTCTIRLTTRLLSPDRDPAQEFEISTE